MHGNEVFVVLQVRSPVSADKRARPVNSDLPESPKTIQSDQPQPSPSALSAASHRKHNRYHQDL